MTSIMDGVTPTGDQAADRGTLTLAIPSIDVPNEQSSPQYLHAGPEIDTPQDVDIKGPCNNEQMDATRAIEGSGQDSLQYSNGQVDATWAIEGSGQDSLRYSNGHINAIRAIEGSGQDLLNSFQESVVTNDVDITDNKPSYLLNRNSQVDKAANNSLIQQNPKQPEVVMNKMLVGDIAQDMLPPRPQEPLASDCCGSGCSPCVNDLYDQEVALWEDECERIRHGGSTATNSEEILSPDKYHTFQLSEIVQETSDSFRYTFIIPRYQPLPISVGQHLVIRWQTTDRVVTRQYTPISPPKLKGKMIFVIKLYPDGIMSEYIRSWRVGELVEWRGPFGNFTYKPNSCCHLVMFAAGTGIAPMVQLIDHILSNHDDDTRLHLVYACRNYSAILCKNALDEWTGYWNFSVDYVLSQDGEDTTYRYGDQVVRGRLTKELVGGYVNERHTSIRILICGTKSFDKDMINHLRAAGISDADIFKF